MGARRIASAQGTLDLPSSPPSPPSSSSSRSVIQILGTMEKRSKGRLVHLHGQGLEHQQRPLPVGVTPLRAVTTARPLFRDAAPRRVQVRPDLELAERVRAVWDEGVEESRELARRFVLLAPSWMEREHPDADPQEVETEDLAVATALRCTRGRARAAVREAHRAIDLLPRCAEALGDGAFPAGWFRTVLERTSDFTDDEMLLIDITVSTWSLGITPEVFTRELGALIMQILDGRDVPPYLEPEARRRVELTPGQKEGTACLRIIGPIPEVMALSRTLDETARAVQDAQRQALRDGTEIPCDPDGQVEREGMPLSLALIRYHLTQGATFDAAGVTLLAQRFRVGLVVPFLSMIGGDSEPAMLDGITPVPAGLARELAGKTKDWYRVLTDPSSGEFLPRPAGRYRPTRAMLEHVRLRGGTCAVPGCTRSASVASEADHIIEYDHEDPAAGGQTEIENLHLLCWAHHAMKTAGLIDPERIRPEDSPTGRRGTAWSIAEQIRVFREDDMDLATPRIVEELTELWDDLQRRRGAHLAAHDPRPDGDVPGIDPPEIARDGWPLPESVQHEVGWRELVRQGHCPAWDIDPGPDPPRRGRHRSERSPQPGDPPIDPGPPPF